MNSLNVPQLRFPGFDGEWETNKLSDWKLKVIDGDRGTNYPNGDDFSTEGYCLFMNAKNVTKNGFSFETKTFITKEKDEKLRKGKLKRNDLILTTRGSVGNIAFYDESIKLDNLRINSGMVLIRNENSSIDSSFIYSSFFTPKLNRIIDTISFGSAQPQLTVKEINLFKLNIPTFPEQQKIASFLSAVDEKIQQLSRKKELLEQYKKGVMQQLFSGKLRFKDENGKDYPDWEEKKLGEIADFHKGKGLPKSDITENGKYKCVHYGELFTKYKESISNIISMTNIYDKPFLSIVNDVLMPTSDVTPNGLATASCINESNVILGGDVLVIRQKVKFLNGIFFSFYISQNRKKVMKLVSGSTVYHLYGSDMKNLQIEIPSLPEQQKIANFLSGIDGKIEQVNGELVKTQEFKKGLLQQMFV